MSTYIFVLGKDRELSLAELFAVYPKAELKHLGEDFVALHLRGSFGQSDLDRLGGVIKVAELQTSTNFKALSSTVLGILREEYAGKKLSYGISVYDWPQKNLRPLLTQVKKMAKKEGLKTRFANQQFKNISSAQYKGLRKEGIELLACRDTKALLVGKVVAVQNIDAYSKRDFEKPFRDMQMGMLPPKLAQILINLTSVQGVIWDPFCGSGTVLMEGVLSGRPMKGSDIAKRHVEGAIKNVDWLKKHFKANSAVDLFQHDATDRIQTVDFEAVATEVDLGKPHSQSIKDEELKAIMTGLHELYFQFFTRLKEANFRGPVVVAFPFFKKRGKKDVEMSETIHAIDKLGFESMSFLPSNLTKNPLRLKYSRPDQAVGRAIYRFQFTR